MASLRQRKTQIEAEFEEPLRDIISGFVQMGHSMPYIASTLEVSSSSVKHYCAAQSIRCRHTYPLVHFPHTGRRSLF